MTMFNSDNSNKVTLTDIAQYRFIVVLMIVSTNCC